VPGWGFSGAPFASEKALILNAGDAGLALDKSNGNVLWQSQNKDAGYSTPYPSKLGAEELVVIGSAQSYVAVNPLSGKEAWRIRWVTQYGVNASDPILDGDRIFLCTGYGKGAALMKLGGPQPQEIWKSKVLRTQLNAAVLFEGHLYGVDGDTVDKAALKCVQFDTGAEKWKEPGFGNGSLVVAGGKLIALSATGELSVAPASPQGFKPVARARVLDGKCWTTPVLANGRLYCRNQQGRVVCLDLRK
jgi:outer membrane protein assembly factor BamB